MAQQRQVPTDTAIITQHQIQILGKNVKYEAHTGFIPLWNSKDEIIATINYTYYRRTDVKDVNTRPIMFSFNGGPGSAAVWMQVAYTGPKLLNIDDEGYPVQPYGIRDNPYSVLDVADLVFVNPVNTGYSRMVRNKEGELPDREQFFGVNEDARYLAEWMSTFISRNNRWESPKYLIGESYGGTRVMALAHELQERNWMYLNGVIMVSPADYKVLRVGGPVSDALNLPYYTATAWYHHRLPAELQNRDLTEILPLAEEFAVNQLMPALARGGFLQDTQRAQIAERIAHFTGLRADRVQQVNLVVTPSYFWKELLRDTSGQTVGRLDSRYLGIDRMDAGMSPDYNAELSSWLHSFTPAINYYMRNDLKFVTDAKYNMFGDVHPWNFDGDNVRHNLRTAMAKNPYLKILIQSGYYDGATTYFQGKYTMWQIDPSGKLSDRISFRGYRSGHMMYLRKEDLKLATDDIRSFLQESSYTNKSAKY
ncbi:MAG: carboxypeptidase [Weeksellaceae bacterium]|nr:carboxypeptidase [Weeksellaceae bacterium]